jgi:YesN/AraC family two-component response regulator
VKLHHGKIEVYSRENEGTTLLIKLPITWETQEHLVQAMEVHKLTPLQTNISLPVATSEEELYSEKLLIVEDNRDLQQFISTQFQNQFTILTAATGTSGLSLATEHLPDIIIADVMMSGIDGIQLVEQLKADERTSHIPVILLTAKADIPSKLEGLRAGADDYMVKPFSTEELKVRVKGLLDARKKLANHYKQHQPDVVKEMPRVHELSMDDKFIAKLQTYIHQNISDTTLSVERLAEEMCMSRTQLFRKLKAILDTSPSELINEIRLTRAAHLIKAKTDNFTQIGYAVGFNEQSYFAKRFRKKFGMSPSEYAEANT